MQRCHTGQRTVLWALGLLVLAVYLSARWLCWRPLPFDRLLAPGRGLFRVEVSGITYYARCDLRIPIVSGVPFESCVGDPLGADFTEGSVQLAVPCTVLRPTVRVFRGDELLFEEVCGAVICR